VETLRGTRDTDKLEYLEGVKTAAQTPDQGAFPGLLFPHELTGRALYLELRCQQGLCRHSNATADCRPLKLDPFRASLGQLASD
jgi:hypothetical protein